MHHYDFVLAVMEYPSGTTGNKKTFALDSSSGKLFLALPLDYERVEKYEIIITAEDSGGLLVSDLVRIYNLSLSVLTNNPPSDNSSMHTSLYG